MLSGAVRSGIVRGKRIPRPVPGGLDVAGITEAFAHRMMYSVAKDQYTASDFDVYQVRRGECSKVERISSVE